MSLELLGLIIIGVIGIAIITLVWSAFWLWWQSQPNKLSCVAKRFDPACAARNRPWPMPSSKP